MYSVIFDERTSCFSAVRLDESTNSYADAKSGFLGSVGSHLKKNAGTYIGGAAGAAGGAMLARKKAKQAALAKGLEPGTPEYKKFVAARTAAGGAAGAAGGAVLGRAGHAAISGHGGNFGAKKMYDTQRSIGSSKTESAKHAAKSAGRSIKSAFGFGK